MSYLRWEDGVRKVAEVLGLRRRFKMEARRGMILVANIP